MNTRFEYMYRDASNYKQTLNLVFEGELTDAEREAFFAHLDDGEYFIAEQVGLPNLREDWESHYEDDHIWHEFVEWEPTEAPATSEDVHSFVARFIATTWDEQAAVAKLQEWVESTPEGH